MAEPTEPNPPKRELSKESQDIANLNRCEAIIERNIEQYMEAALAFMEIKENKYYRRKDFRTWDEYCQKRWGKSASYANRIIRASNFVKRSAQTVPIGTALRNEHQVRKAIEAARNAEPIEVPFEAVPIEVEPIEEYAVQAERRAVENEEYKAASNAYWASPNRETTDPTRIRCNEMMRELRNDPHLAKMVRIELEIWYAFNG